MPEGEPTPDEALTGELSEEERAFYDRQMADERSNKTMLAEFLRMSPEHRQRMMELVEQGGNTEEGKQDVSEKSRRANRLGYDKENEPGEGESS